MIDVEIQLKFNNKQYQSFLNRLKKLVLLISTVGVHSQDGKQKVIRRYTPFGKTNNKNAGKTSRMTIAKLAYQNEFGATIEVKPKYRTRTKKRTSVSYNSNSLTSTKTIIKYSVLRNAREQGYLLRDKSGKFVAYFRPNSLITIPERSFLRKTAKNIDPNLYNQCSNILKNILVDKTLNPKQGISSIAKLVDLKVKQNIRTVMPKNNELTRKAKGFNQPLIDEQDRILKSIKYKVYNNPYIMGTAGHKAYVKQFEKHTEELLKSAKIFENIATIKTITTTSTIE